MCWVKNERESMERIGWARRVGRVRESSRGRTWRGAGCGLRNDEVVGELRRAEPGSGEGSRPALSAWPGVLRTQGVGVRDRRRSCQA